LLLEAELILGQDGDYQIGGIGGLTDGQNRRRQPGLQASSPALA
jgi:hypothetical protein